MDMELRINKRNTTAFIAAKPTYIVLNTTTRLETPAGGYKDVPDYPRDRQKFRIIELGTNAAPPIIQLTDGQQREAEFWLLGEADAAIAINDWWEAPDGRKWLVGDIIRPNGYEMRALVAERGK